MIDPEICGCGDGMKDHGYYDGHSPLPMGCNCLRSDRELIGSLQSGLAEVLVDSRMLDRAIQALLLTPVPCTCPALGSDSDKDGECPGCHRGAILRDCDYVRDRIALTCGECGGAGERTNGDVTVSCPKCDGIGVAGRGVRKGRCKDCQGTGRVKDDWSQQQILGIWPANEECGIQAFGSKYTCHQPADHDGPHSDVGMQWQQVSSRVSLRDAELQLRQLPGAERVEKLNDEFDAMTSCPKCKDTGITGRAGTLCPNPKCNDSGVTDRPLPRLVNGIPRRILLSSATTMEQAIRAAMAAIEAGPADVRLTKASMAVQDALAWVADYFEDVPEAEHYPRPVAPKTIKSCNMHRDCDAAEVQAAKDGKPERYGTGSVRLEHCTDDCCEDCFGC